MTRAVTWLTGVLLAVVVLGGCGSSPAADQAGGGPTSPSSVTTLSPTETSSTPETVKVPRVLGLPQRKAQKALVEAGLVPAWTYAPKSIGLGCMETRWCTQVTKGMTFFQRPRPHTVVQPGSVVRVVVAAHRPK